LLFHLPTRPRRSATGQAKRLLACGAFVGALPVLSLPGVAAHGGWRTGGLSPDRPGRASRYGSWQVVNLPPKLRVNAVHATLLRTGKVLIISGSGNNETQFDTLDYKTLLWDPVTGKAKLIPTPADLFCGGHSQLPDGKVLVAGGTRHTTPARPPGKHHRPSITMPHRGIRDAYVFDPDSERYEPVSPMREARWYPTLTPLSDGRVLAVSGIDDTGAIAENSEVYDPESGEWNAGPKRFLATYPALFLTSRGDIFYSGANAEGGPDKKENPRGEAPGLWSLASNDWRPVTGLRDAAMTQQMATVLLPPANKQQVMVMGGGDPEAPRATARTAVVDLDSDRPHFTPGPELPLGKVRYLNAVTLPDDTVLTTGGSRQTRGAHDSDILQADIYHPGTRTFTAAARPSVGRDYHSEALLLPDGRVVTMGSDPLYGNAADTIPGRFEQRLEIYSPPYLFHGRRPTIGGGPDRMFLGDSAGFQTSSPGDIAQIRLIRPSSVTHVTDVQQRSIAVPFETIGEGVEISIPRNPNLVIPGWYMLFAVDKHGTPSVARWVQILDPDQD
jgi:hypothetical protein